MGGLLRSYSLQAPKLEERKENFSKVKSLQKQVILTLKKRKPRDEITRKCNEEFDFVNFDTLKESHTELSDKAPKKASDVKNVVNVDDNNANVVSSQKKGVLWQQSDKLFSSWQERFFVLTSNSLYSFSKDTRVMDNVKKTVLKTKLKDIKDVSLVEKKGQLLMRIVIENRGKVYLRKPEGLQDWYEQLRRNISAVNFANPGRNLRSCLSLVENTSTKPKQDVLMIPLARPHMGVSSLNWSIHSP